MIGVGKGRPSPPSEPCMRFSRTRLSSRWFPHRDWHANMWASHMVKSPRSAKKAFIHLLSPRCPGLSTYVPSIPMLPPNLQASSSCLANFGTNEAKNCTGIDISHPTFLPSFPRPGFANQDFRQRCVTCGIMRALTPAIPHLGLQVSPFTATYLPIVPPPTT